MCSILTANGVDLKVAQAGLHFLNWQVDGNKKLLTKRCLKNIKPEMCSVFCHGRLHVPLPSLDYTQRHLHAAAQVRGITDSVFTSCFHLNPFPSFLLSLDCFHPWPPPYSTSPTLMQFSPPTLLLASSLCQLKALNTHHLTLSMFLSALTPSGLFTLDCFISQYMLNDNTVGTHQQSVWVVCVFWFLEWIKD